MKSPPLFLSSAANSSSSNTQNGGSMEGGYHIIFIYIYIYIIRTHTYLSAKPKAGSCRLKLSMYCALTKARTRVTHIRMIPPDSQRCRLEFWGFEAFVLSLGHVLFGRCFRAVEAKLTQAMMKRSAGMQFVPVLVEGRPKPDSEPAAHLGERGP